jgi:hypothetical protein
MPHSRNKGNSLELIVAKAFSKAFGVTIRRTPLSGGWSHENPETAGDLVCTTPGADFPYCVECKNVEGWKLESLFNDNHKWFDDWWRQARDESNGKTPISVFSKAFAPKLAVIRTSDLDEIQSAYLQICVDGDVLIIMAMDSLLYMIQPRQ